MELLQTFRMIDVGAKAPSYRLAVASGRITVGKEAYELIINKNLPKGDVLTLAEIAGIQGAKNAWQTIPLCHPMLLDHAGIFVEPEAESSSFRVYCFVSTVAKTGVEMEALAGVNSALLTIYDLTKMVEAALVISDVKLLVKLGGKKGLWICPGGAPTWVMEKVSAGKVNNLSGIRGAVITLSDRASKGEYEDKSGALIKSILEKSGADLVAYEIIPDDKEKLQTIVKELCDNNKADFIITTGGTGISPRDITPEAIAEIADKVMPGIGELLRQDGAKYTPNSWSSRSLGATRKQTIIISLPGSTKAIQQGMPLLTPLIPHLVNMIAGKGHD